MSDDIKKGEVELSHSNFNLSPIPEDRVDAVCNVLLRHMHRADEASRPAANLARGEAGVGVLKEDKSSIKYFFSQWKNSIYEEASEIIKNPDVMLGPGNTYSGPEECIGQAQEETKWVEALEKQFDAWLAKDESPFQLLERLQKDLREQGCTKGSQREYRNVSCQYMRWANYAPRFERGEVSAYILHLQGRGWKEGSISNHLVILKRWFEVLGRPWPFLRRKRRDLKVRERSRTAPTLTPKQVAQLVKLVKAKGIDEDRYLMAIATTWAPRREELGKINSMNFVWNDDTGTLKFMPMKNNYERIHRVPKELVPYLKPYSQQAPALREWVVGSKFTEMCHRIGFQLPGDVYKLPPEERKKVKNKRLFCNIHAFRHSIETELMKRGIPRHIINIWFGYSLGRDMPSYYYTVDAQEVQRADDQIMKKHPYVKLWAD
jgi:integrase